MAKKMLGNAKLLVMVRDMVENVARFCDHHDVIVPEIKISYMGLQVTFSAKKLEEGKPEDGA